MVSGSGSLPQSIAGINSQSDPRFGVPVDASMGTFASPGLLEKIAVRKIVWIVPWFGNAFCGVVGSGF